MRRITLLTDFGTADGYVGAMKGVIATIAPFAVVDDITHDIPPGDVRGAAWALRNVALRYPPDTVHMIVVDPGVGSSRRALAGHVHGRYVVAPDNGVLSFLLDEADAAFTRLHEVSNRSWMGDVVSATFHGRDIFAPVAARLAGGEPLETCGPAVRDPVCFPIPRPRCSGRTARGSVVHVDRFGNLVTNIPGAWLPDERGEVVVRSGGHVFRMPMGRTYSDVRSGELVLLTGSAGTLEVSRRDGSAATATGWGTDTAIQVDLQ